MYMEESPSAIKQVSCNYITRPKAFWFRRKDQISADHFERSELCEVL